MMGDALSSALELFSAGWVDLETPEKSVGNRFKPFHPTSLEGDRVFCKNLGICSACLGIWH
jgi:hypothetical protein